MNIDVDPHKMAKWLQVTLNQRKRAHVKAEMDYGQQSAAAIELAGECDSINTAISSCIKLAAKTPHSNTR